MVGAIVKHCYKNYLKEVNRSRADKTTCFEYENICQYRVFYFAVTQNISAYVCA